jgi:hypothetical protein
MLEIMSYPRVEGVSLHHSDLEQAPLDENDRIRKMFEIARDAPLPRVGTGTLLRYHAHLSQRLSFPFQAMYAETRRPVQHLFRYISVLRLLPVTGPASRGIHCAVEGVPGVRELPLVDIGLREDNPNYQEIDDYAYWFLNSW